MVAEPFRPARMRARLRLQPVPAPCIVIDAAGVEVGALIDWPEYVALLTLLAADARTPALSPYWRRAIRDCPGAVQRASGAG